MLHANSPSDMVCSCGDRLLKNRRHTGCSGRDLVNLLRRHAAMQQEIAQNRPQSHLRHIDTARLRRSASSEPGNKSTGLRTNAVHSSVVRRGGPQPSDRCDGSSEEQIRSDGGVSSLLLPSRLFGRKRRAGHVLIGARRWRGRFARGCLDKLRRRCRHDRKTRTAFVRTGRH
jgi:hypothetical protein